VPNIAQRRCQPPPAAFCYGSPRRTGFASAACCCASSPESSSFCSSCGAFGRSRSCSRARGNFRSHVVNFTLCGVGFASVGFSHACLGLTPSPISFLFRTAFASFSFLSSCGVFSRFPHVFFFFASLRLIVSWFIIVFLSLCFLFPYPFYLGLFI